jgi:ferredoxin/flavodoxin---NADP+ reductase
MTMTDDTTTGLVSTAALSAETVLSVRHWNEHLFSFTITRPSSFRFRSGEFVMIGLPINGKPLLRAYSIASPSYAEELDFLSIKVPDGPLTSELQKITPGDQIYLGRKPTGTLVADALVPGKRLWLLSSGTGLAPFLSVIRDPDIYGMFEKIVVVHSVRRVNDLAYRAELSSLLAEDPLVSEEAKAQLAYLPIVTREPFANQLRITRMIDEGSLFARAGLGDGRLAPDTDRVMLCGSMAMIKEIAGQLDGLGFTEGSNAKPGDYVIERAFAG